MITGKVRYVLGIKITVKIPGSTHTKAQDFPEPGKGRGWGERLNQNTFFRVYGNLISQRLLPETIPGVGDGGGGT